jgi:hypothetical protein
MKPIKKFSMISTKAEAVNESANENQEAVMNLLNKMGYTSIEELKKEKNLLSKLEALVKEFDAKKDISEEEIEEDRAEDIEADIKAKGTPRSLEGEEGDKEEDGEIGGSESDGEVAEEEEVEAEGGEEIEEDKAKDIEGAEKDIATPKQLDDKEGEKISDDQELTDEVPAEADDETSGRKIKTFEEYIKEKEITINKNIKYHDDDEEPEDYAVPVAASAEPMAEDDHDDDEEKGSEDERKGDELEDKGDKKVDSEDDKEKEDHYKGAVKSDDEEIDALKKDVEYDKEEEEDAKKDESRIMSFAKFVTEGYGMEEDDYDEDEESNEYGSGMEEDDYDEDEEANEDVAEVIAKEDKAIKSGSGEIPIIKGDGPETAAGIAGDDMERGKPKSVEGKGKDLITKDQEITDVVKGEGDDIADGTEVVKEAKVAEKEITNDADFKDYAFAILKDAHGDKFDEAKAMEVVDGLKDKYKGDYGAMVGALQSSMGA